MRFGCRSGFDHFLLRVYLLECSRRGGKINAERVSSGPSPPRPFRPQSNHVPSETHVSPCSPLPSPAGHRALPFRSAQNHAAAATAALPSFDPLYSQCVVETAKSLTSSSKPMSSIRSPSSRQMYLQQNKAYPRSRFRWVGCPRQV